MACKDLIYPQNGKMKLELADLSGRMKANMRMCVRATNTLIDCIEKYLPGRNFEKIMLQTSDSVNDICNLVSTRIEEVKQYVAQKEYEVRDLLGTELFNQLMDPSANISQKYDIACMVVIATEGIAFCVRGIFLLGCLVSWDVLKSFSAMVAAVGISVYGFISLAILLSSVDLIVSAIIGHYEKKYLENSLKESRKSVLDFEDASNTFCDNVYRVSIMIECRMQHRVQI